MSQWSWMTGGTGLKIKDIGYHLFCLWNLRPGLRSLNHLYLWQIFLDQTKARRVESFFLETVILQSLPLPPPPPSRSGYGTDISLCLPPFVRSGIISFKRDKMALECRVFCVLVKSTGSYTEVNLDKCFAMHVSTGGKGLHWTHWQWLVINSPNSLILPSRSLIIRMYNIK